MPFCGLGALNAVLSRVAIIISPLGGVDIFPCLSCINSIDLHPRVRPEKNSSVDSGSADSRAQSTSDAMVDSARHAGTHKQLSIHLVLKISKDRESSKCASCLSNFKS